MSAPLSKSSPLQQSIIPLASFHRPDLRNCNSKDRRDLQPDKLSIPHQDPLSPSHAPRRTSGKHPLSNRSLPSCAIRRVSGWSPLHHPPPRAPIRPGLGPLHDTFPSAALRPTSLGPPTSYCVSRTLCSLQDAQIRYPRFLDLASFQSLSTCWRGKVMPEPRRSLLIAKMSHTPAIGKFNCPVCGLIPS